MSTVSKPTSRPSNLHSLLEISEEDVQRGVDSFSRHRARLTPSINGQAVCGGGVLKTGN